MNSTQNVLSWSDYLAANEESSQLSTQDASWSDYLAANEKAAQLVEENDWIPFFLVWLSWQSPYITRCQVVDFLKHLFKNDPAWVGKSADRVRYCFNKLVEYEVLSPKIRTYWRPLTLKSTRLRTNKWSDVVSLIIESQNQKGLASGNQDEPLVAHCLHQNAPKSDVIRSLTSNDELHDFHDRYALELYQKRLAEKSGKPSPEHLIPGPARAPKGCVFTDGPPGAPPIQWTIQREDESRRKNKESRLRLMDFPHWLSNAEHLLKMYRSSNSISALAATATAVSSGVEGSPSRILAVREQELTRGALKSHVQLDETCSRFRNEFASTSPETSTANASFGKERFSQHCENTILILRDIESRPWKESVLIY